MKYMLMMHTPSGGPYEIFNWPEKDIRAHGEHFQRINRGLEERGELLVVQGLVAPDQARRVRAGPDGRPETDGIFPESKEFLAGYWIVDVESAQRADEIAADISMAPGPGGAPLHMTLEIRGVMDIGGDIP